MNSGLSCPHCLARTLPQPLTFVLGTLAWALFLRLLVGNLFGGWGSSSFEAAVWRLSLGSSFRASSLCRGLRSCPLNDISTLLLLHFLDLLLAILVDVNDVLLNLCKLSLETRHHVVEFILACFSLC